MNLQAIGILQNKDIQGVVDFNGCDITNQIFLEDGLTVARIEKRDRKSVV